MVTRITVTTDARIAAICVNRNTSILNALRFFTFLIPLYFFLAFVCFLL
nr:MAG TPA: hypothetical protein [Caudoviricetes sp.]